MTPTRIATGLVVVAVLASPRAFADRGAEAQALFDQGIADFKAGKLDQACPELAASLAKHDDTGTKGALAVCEQSRGRVATSWKLWRDLSDTATDPADRDDARAHATALEPRLPRYVIHTAASPVGVVVSINGVEADPSISTPLPIDPGPLVVVAHATGRVDWTHTFDATEGQLVAIDVPELALIAQPPTPPVTTTV